MVKAVRVHQPGPPEALQIEDLEIGTPGEGEALVQIQANEPGQYAHTQDYGGDKNACNASE